MLGSQKSKRCPGQEGAKVVGWGKGEAHTFRGWSQIPAQLIGSVTQIGGFILSTALGWGLDTCVLALHLPCMLCG